MRVPSEYDVKRYRYPTRHFLGSCPVAGSGVSKVETSGSATRELVNSKMGLRELDYEDGRWMELAQDRVQWRALMLATIETSGSAIRIS
jgi:hypothetical protein